MKVEIGQYREMNKGSLKAFFSLVIHPTGQKILDCRYFVNGDNKWFSFPQKEIKYTDGRKTEYIPYVSFANKEFLAELQTAVLAALKDAKPQETHGKTQNPAPQTTTAQVQAEPQATWF